MSNMIKSYRLKKEISLLSLAKKIKIPQTTLWRYENGKTSPKAPELQKIAQFFNVTIDELLKEE